MATIPIHNPVRVEFDKINTTFYISFIQIKQLPFLGLIPGGLRPGKMLRFRGVVHQEGRCVFIFLFFGCN